MESKDFQKASHSLWERIQEVSEANFGDEVLACPLPVWVAFGAFWSFYCRTMDSLLSEIVLLCEGRAKVVWADADVNLGLSLWFEVMELPTLLYFVGGEVRAKIVGVSGKEKILPQIESIMNLKTK